LYGAGGKLVFSLKNNLTVPQILLQCRFFCSELECLYEKLYGKERAG